MAKSTKNAGTPKSGRVRRLSTPRRGKTPNQDDQSTEESPPEPPCRYVLEWVTDMKPKDPIFRSPETFAAFQASVGIVQPYDHCQADYFPIIASKFGLDRYVPSKSIPIGRRGPVCIVNGERWDDHRTCLPAFLYHHKDLKCEVATKHKFPTLIFRYNIISVETDSGFLNELKLLACWACYTKQYSRCTLIDTMLSELDEVESFNPTFLSSGTETTKPLLPSPDRSDSRVGGTSSDLSPLPTDSHFPITLPHSPAALTAKGPTMPFPPPLQRATSARPPSPDRLPPNIPMKRSRSVATVDHSPTPRSSALPSSSTDLRLSHNTLSLQLNPAPAARKWHTYFDKMEARKASGSSTQSRGPSSTMESLPENPLNMAWPPNNPLGSQLPIPSITLPPTQPTGVDPPPSDLANSALQSIPTPTRLRPDMQQLRDALESTMASTVRAAQENFHQTQESKLVITDKLQRLFNLVEVLSQQAASDRKSIDMVRKEKDEQTGILHAMDTRLVEYGGMVAAKDRAIQDLQVKLDRANEEAAASKRLQEIADQRMQTAVIARDTALKEAEAASTARDTALRVAADADANRMEAEEALSDAHSEVAEVNLQLTFLQNQLTTLHAQLAGTTPGITPGLSNAISAVSWPSQSLSEPTAPNPLYQEQVQSEQSQSQQLQTSHFPTQHSQVDQGQSQHFPPDQAHQLLFEHSQSSQHHQTQVDHFRLQSEELQSQQARPSQLQINHLLSANDSQTPHPNATLSLNMFSPFSQSIDHTTGAGTPPPGGGDLSLQDLHNIPGGYTSHAS